MNKFLRSGTKSYQRGCLFTLIAAAIAIPLTCILVFIPVYFATRSGVSSSQSLWIMVIPASLYLLILIGGGAAAVLYFIRRRSRWMDDIFIPLGLEGRSYTITGRQYHGTIAGRKVDVLYYRGPALNIYIESDIGTRLSLSPSDNIIPALSGLFKKEPFRLDDIPDQVITVIAHEERWARQLVAQAEVVGLVRELVFDDTDFLYQQVFLSPGSLSFRLFGTDKMFDVKIDPQQGSRWVDTLIRLTEYVEQKPAPEEHLEESELEQRTQRGTLNVTRIAIIVIAIFLVISILLILGISAVVILLSG
ncbi:MAG: hypothetical protein MUO76_05395 [Anaerolineaceae bacterium]|nr:hypothetical protein [Anaerolineaceae bacterium]